MLVSIMHLLKFYLFLLSFFSLNLLIAQSMDENLVSAAKNGDIDTVKTAVLNGGNVNFIDDFKWTPLIWATRNNYIDIVRFLLECGAKISLNGTETDAVDVARMNGFKDIEELLLSEDYIYKNLTKEDDLSSGDISVKTPILNAELKNGAVYYRLFAKMEEGSVFFAIRLKFLNAIQKNPGGFAFALSKRYETYSSEFENEKYKGIDQFTQIYTIIFNENEFKEFLTQKEDVLFGVRRGKLDFDFKVSISSFRALFKITKDLNWIN